MRVKGTKYRNFLDVMSPEAQERMYAGQEQTGGPLLRGMTEQALKFLMPQNVEESVMGMTPGAMFMTEMYKKMAPHVANKTTLAKVIKNMGPDMAALVDKLEVVSPERMQFLEHKASPSSASAGISVNPFHYQKWGKERLTAQQLAKGTSSIPESFLPHYNAAKKGETSIFIQEGKWEPKEKTLAHEVMHTVRDALKKLYNPNISWRQNPEEVIAELGAHRFMGKGVGPILKALKDKFGFSLQELAKITSTEGEETLRAIAEGKLKGISRPSLAIEGTKERHRKKIETEIWKKGKQKWGT